MIIVLTVAVPLAPQGVEYFVRRQISVFPFPLLKMRIADQSGIGIGARITFLPVQSINALFFICVNLRHLRLIIFGKRELGSRLRQSQFIKAGHEGS